MKNRYTSGIETENKIYDAAVRLFYEKGPNNTKNVEIAEKAYVHKSLINHYFGNKETLFMQIATDERNNIYKNAKTIANGNLKLSPIIYIICFYHLMNSDKAFCRIVKDYFNDFNFSTPQFRNKYSCFLKELHLVLYGDGAFLLPNEDMLCLYRRANIYFTCLVADSIFEKGNSFDSVEIARIDLLNKVIIFGKDAYDRLIPVFKEAVEVFKNDPFSSRKDFSEYFQNSIYEGFQETMEASSECK